MNECLALADLGASINLMPLSIWKELSLPALTKTRIRYLKLADRNDFLSKPTSPEDCFRDVKVGTHDDQSVTFKVGDTKTLSYNIIETVNRVDVIDIACEEYVQEVLETSESGNPTSTSDLTIDSRSPSFTPFGGNTVYLEELLSVINSDPNPPPSPVCEIDVPEKVKSSCEDPPDLELKDLPSHLEYAFLEGDDKLPVIIAKTERWDKTCPDQGLKCTVAIFHDMIEKTMEVFMDDFSIFGDSFSSCLSHLDKMLQRCEDTNLVLNWEKCHFMVKEGIVLGHKISKTGIEVDKAKVDVIAKLPHPTTVKGIRSFLGHAGFYQRFIQDFSKIAQPMTHLLEKETQFIFSKECIEAFKTLKMKLTHALILVAPDWDLPFEIMCDASDFTVGAVLGQQFDVVIRDKKGAENLTADHLSRLETPHQSELEKKQITETFPLETLGMVTFRSDNNAPWFADFTNYHAGNFVFKGMSSQQKNKFFKDVKHYF
ncbi:reverse transcriptase domain-containing protein [Tanacetum coccineum]